MTSLRQIEANRRNATLSTGPRTQAGKKRSRRNAIRHGLTAETVIDALEDAQDYAAFEVAVTSGYDAYTAVERELVLRLASLFWRLRRATAIESGLFKLQAQHLLKFKRRRALRELQQSNRHVCSLAIVTGHESRDDDNSSDWDRQSKPTSDLTAQSDDLTRSFMRLSNIPNCPLDRLSRYEAALWRQTRQVLFALRCQERQRV
jgi:hypothetical protein